MSADEYEKITAPYSQDSTVVFAVNLDENMDYQNDVFCYWIIPMSFGQLFSRC